MSRPGAYPERARPSFVGLKILTLDEVINIAEGNPQQKPGLYIETKEPKLFPGIERDLKDKLQDRGWLSPSGSKLAKRALGVGQGKGKVVLQTFDKSSLELLHKEMPKVPKILLLWVGEGNIEPKSKVPFAESGETDKAVYYAKQEPKDKAEFEYSWQWAYHDRFKQPRTDGIAGLDVEFIIKAKIRTPDIDRDPIVKQIVIENEFPEVRHHQRHAGAEVDVGTFGNVLRDAPGDLLPGQLLHQDFLVVATTRCTKTPGVTMWSGWISPTATTCSTSAKVTFPAVATIGLKLRAV